LQYVDEELIALPQKGDLMLFAQCEALHTTRQGDYWATGVSGYFKVDVYDGKKWQPVSLPELFPGREHHFSKTECPIDTYEFCKELIIPLTSRILLRTYREHYVLET
jgi:hypothetical protein